MIRARLVGTEKGRNGGREVPNKLGKMMLVECVELFEGPSRMTVPPPQPRRQDRRRAGLVGLPRVLLASRSARRRLMLEDAGIEHDLIDSGVDDGELRPGKVDAEHWVAALAYLKAAAARERVSQDGDAVRDARGMVVLGADTVVVDDGEIIGQPRDRADAERILRRLIGGEHEVLTGVAMVEVSTGRRDLLVDRARVRVGSVAEAELQKYLDSGMWAGKAGAYNLAERVEAGWPIEVEGDPGTVMGLPMRRLEARLAGFAAGSA